jgi:hypothetical protein
MCSTARVRFAQKEELRIGKTRDLLVPGEVSREEQRVLWSVAEDITRAEGVEFDLHFPAVYAGDFTDRIKVILGGKVAPLRDLLAAARDPKTHEK